MERRSGRPKEVTLPYESEEDKSTRHWRRENFGWTSLILSISLISWYVVFGWGNLSLEGRVNYVLIGGD